MIRETAVSRANPECVARPVPQETMANVVTREGPDNPDLLACQDRPVPQATSVKQVIQDQMEDVVCRVRKDQRASKDLLETSVRKDQRVSRVLPDDPVLASRELKDHQVLMDLKVNPEHPEKWDQ